MDAAQALFSLTVSMPYASHAAMVWRDSFMSRRDKGYRCAATNQACSLMQSNAKPRDVRLHSPKSKPVAERRSG